MANVQKHDTSIMAEVADLIACREAMSGSVLHLGHGSRLFYVPQGWESRRLESMAQVVRCHTMMDLEAALRDENIKVIFLPHDAMMSQGDVEKICQRNAAVKTIFWEARKV